MCGFLAFKGYLDIYIYIYIYIDTHTRTQRRGYSMCGFLAFKGYSLQRVFYIYICHEEGPVEVFSFYIFLVQYISGLRYKL
jgi:hypothetical protein